LHAIAVLDGLGLLSEDVVLKALADDHPRIREFALRKAEKFAQSASVQSGIATLATDDDVRVRCQFAFTAGEFPLQCRIPWLTAVLREAGEERSIQVAALSSLSDGALRVFERLISDPAFSKSETNRELLGMLAEQIVRANREDEVAALVGLLGRMPDDSFALRRELFFIALKTA